MTNNTIINLEAFLTEEEVMDIRKKSLGECSIDGAVGKGMPYIADLMRIYRNNLMDRCYEKREGDLK